MIFRVDEDSPFRHMIDGRTYPTSPKNPEAIRKINHWLLEASELDSCAPTPDQSPSRLLEIKDEGAKVNLVRSTSKPVQYMALSHCWGSTRPITLTKSSLSQLEEGVETSCLPQSFQDAIWLTHRLGVQYLWIDSLCILQDSQQDWVRESAKMRDVYENSWLTIAASRASDSEQGFLGDQDHYESVSIPYRAGDTSGEVMACIVPIEYADDPTDNVYLNNDPLTTRGWALQERYIARRILHFSRSQVLLEHNGKVFTQDSCDYTWLNSYNPASGVDHVNWYSLVEQYSARKLTMESDKLPALAGLAAYFAAHLAKGKDSAYLAGLWREDMLTGLCWQRGLDDTSQGTSPQSYRAPSWSWAANDGSILYHFRKDSIRELSIVEDAYTSLASTDSPFGEVQGGWARLRGILLRPQGKKDHPIFTMFYFCENGEYFDIDAFWDIESGHEAADAAAGETDLRFIPLIYTVEEGTSQYWVFFLVVEQAKHEVGQHSDLQGYRRVGAGLALPKKTDNARGVGFIKLRDVGAIKLAEGKWTGMLQAGQLEDIILI
ncbi:hypothetical protein PG996_011874 [Apiospora saccharicola]|uniref:Heterokaryon incompatibility domain-containing protein n=1 Tax=Apiospora saccharicola TaxID=335842 RepID=A0ABR1UGU1_9PEZI